MIKKLKKISVLGDGGWGTTIALHLTKQKHDVLLWGPFRDYVDEMRKSHQNKKFLPGIKLPHDLKLTSDLSEALQSDLIIFAVPSQYMAPTIERVKNSGISFKNKAVLSVTKGIDTHSLQRMSSLIAQKLGKIPIAVLSGPNIASEIARGVPSTAVVASQNKKLANAIQTLFNSQTFRIYTNSDVVGVELGGSLKNIMAIACGVCDGLGYGTNTKSALMTRGLAEMTRLGKILGAKEKTFFGLSGLGDLATTSFNPNSRNRTVGEHLGKGKSIDEILKATAMVAEGVETVKAVHALTKKLRISMPITSEVYNIIYRNKNPRIVVTDLMRRKTKAE